MRECSNHHDPKAIRSWWTHNIITCAQDWLVVCCLDCQTVVRGSAEEYEEYLHANGYHC